MDATSTIEELVQELNQPDLNGWKLFAQTSGLSVYRRPDDVCLLFKLACSISSSAFSFHLETHAI